LNAEKFLSRAAREKKEAQAKLMKKPHTYNEKGEPIPFNSINMGHKSDYFTIKVHPHKNEKIQPKE
jgi:hypothetical protein